MRALSKLCKSGGILDNQPRIFLDRYKKSCNNIGMLSSIDVAKVVIFNFEIIFRISGQNIIVDDGWSLLKCLKILITGADGFIGSHLTELPWKIIEVKAFVL